jgi:hypothetical protein
MNTPIIWTASDATGINEFLRTPLGIKWLATLMTLKPKVDITKGTEVASLSGAYSAGYEHLLNEVIPSTRAVRGEDTASLKPIDMTKD